MTPPRDAEPLAGRVALVTGGARRIGATLTERLARAGADVVIHHNASHGEAVELVERVGKLGRRAWTVEADFSHVAGSRRIVPEAVALAGRIDLLVNNASIYPQQTLQETNDHLLHNTLDVNAWAPFALMQAFADDAEDGGAIVNVLDTHVHRLSREKFAYQLSKQTLSWLTRATALSYAPRLRVNAVAPGAIFPPPGQDDAYLDRIGERIPLRRHGSPDDVADAVIFLATSNFITGATIEVDGGEHLEDRRHG